VFQVKIRELGYNTLNGSVWRQEPDLGLRSHLAELDASRDVQNEEKSWGSCHRDVRNFEDLVIISWQLRSAWKFEIYPRVSQLDHRGRFSF
jgi:hypothetical protein